MGLLWLRQKELRAVRQLLRPWHRAHGLLWQELWLMRQLLLWLRQQEMLRWLRRARELLPWLRRAQELLRWQQQQELLNRELDSDLLLWPRVQELLPWHRVQRRVQELLLGLRVRPCFPLRLRQQELLHQRTLLELLMAQALHDHE